MAFKSTALTGLRDRATSQSGLPAKAVFELIYDLLQRLGQRDSVNLAIRFGRIILCLALIAPAGCAVQRPAGTASSPIEVAFSPEAGAEALVLKVISSARQSIYLAGYSFTTPAVVRGLIDAKRRGVNVKVLLDDKGNRGQSSVAAMNLIVGADIPVWVVSVYAIHHDKYIVADGKHTETGSFNFSQAAAKSNSENVLVIRDNPTVAERYLS